MPEVTDSDIDPGGPGERAPADQDDASVSGALAAGNGYLPDSAQMDGPLPGMDAFVSDTPEAVMTRGAQLLLMGQSLEAGDEPGDELAGERQTEMADLGLPTTLSMPRTANKTPTIRGLHDEARKSLSWDSDMPGHEIPTTVRLWDGMQDKEGGSAALALIFSQLNSRYLAVRVAAASALSRLAPMDPSIRMILLDGMRSSDATLRTVAGMALSEAGNTRPDEEIPPVRHDYGERRAGQRQASITVHGTFSALPRDRKDKPWHRPGDPLHGHLLEQVGLGLFQERKRYFRWSGEYSGAQRARATQDLLLWAGTNGVDCFDVIYAHSHGGNIVMSAAAQGLKVRVLVLMHVPILFRPPAEWTNIASNVSRVIQLKTRCDWVVLADRSGQKIPSELPHTVPTTGPLGSWFSHSFFTRVPTWEERGLASLVSYEHSLSTDFAER